MEHVSFSTYIYIYITRCVNKNTFSLEENTSFILRTILLHVSFHVSIIFLSSIHSVADVQNSTRLVSEGWQTYRSKEKRYTFACCMRVQLVELKCSNGMVEIYSPCNKRITRFIETNCTCIYKIILLFDYVSKFLNSKSSSLDFLLENKTKIRKLQEKFNTRIILKFFKTN